MVKIYDNKQVGRQSLNAPYANAESLAVDLAVHYSKRRKDFLLLRINYLILPRKGSQKMTRLKYRMPIRRWLMLHLNY